MRRASSEPYAGGLLGRKGDLKSRNPALRTAPIRDLPRFDLFILRKILDNGAIVLSADTSTNLGECARCGLSASDLSLMAFETVLCPSLSIPPALFFRIAENALLVKKFDYAKTK